MKVFLAVTSLNTTYGGPAYSVSGLAVALAEVGVEVGLWAPDQSVATSSLLPPNSSVQRLSGIASKAFERFGNADVLHDNGMWLRHNHWLAQVGAERGVPRLVSTRGMLEPWALNHKRFKKKLAWWLFQRGDLKSACCHHTTAETESRNLESLGLSVPIVMIPNGVDVPEILGKGKKAVDVRESGKKIALFVGRIYPVKGLPMLIEAWARVGPRDWHLQIAGPDEAGHRTEIERLAAEARITETVTFLGPLEGDAKREVFYGANLFVLPTHSENFGIVIAEALAHGVPVLTTTGAPWPELPERDCGWWVKPTVEDIVKGLQRATAKDVAELAQMGLKGRDWVSKKFAWDSVARRFVAAYESMLAAK